MNEDMKAAWLEISQMLGEPTREELDVFLRTWQRAIQSERNRVWTQDHWTEYERSIAADEREACAYRVGIALLGADRGLAHRVDQAIRTWSNT